MSRPRPKYQVFISSTFSDLHKERQAVTLEVLAVGHIPSGMESFPATDDRGWKTIQRTIDMADYYVLLMAGRYGTVDSLTGLSWTEREYEYAKSKGVPVLAFLREKASITADKMEAEHDRQTRLNAFVTKVQTGHMYKAWREVDDLKGLVVQGLTQHISNDEDEGHPRPGWYRGTDVPGAQVVDEPARQPDVRVLISAGYVGRDADMVPRLVVEVQNHSTAPFFFCTLRFSLASGKMIVISREAAYGLPLLPEKIEPGNGKSIVIDLLEMQAAVDQGDALANAFVVDKIDRRYFADAKATTLAIANTMTMLGKEAGYASPKGGTAPSVIHAEVQRIVRKNPSNECEVILHGDATPHVGEIADLGGGYIRLTAIPTNFERNRNNAQVIALSAIARVRAMT
jgi:hypothetical protein